MSVTRASRINNAASGSREQYYANIKEFPNVTLGKTTTPLPSTVLERIHSLNLDSPEVRGSLDSKNVYTNA